MMLLLDSVTLVALGAAAVNLAVQVEVPGPVTEAGEQLRLLICAAPTRLIVAWWLWPLKVAVTMALWLPLTVPEVAVKVELL